MITLTAPNGSKVNIDGRKVIRSRRVLYGESKEANTRIDWVELLFVKETIDEVAPRIQAELSSFTALTSRDGSRIWFDAERAEGPVELTPSQMDGPVKSAFRIMGYRQYVTETPDKVRAVIKAAGGTPLP